MAKIIPLKDQKAIRETEDNFSLVYDSYRFLTQSNGKTLNAQDREVLCLLIEMTKNKLKAPAKLDYLWLQNKFGKSQITIRRILKKLAPLFNCDFKRVYPNKGTLEFCKIHVTRTPAFEQIINNAYFALGKNKEENDKIFYEKLEKRMVQKQSKNDQKTEQKCSEIESKMIGGAITFDRFLYKNNKELNKNISCVKTCARAEQVLDLKEKLMETNTSDEIFFFGEKQEYSSTGEKQEEHISDVLEITKEQEYASKEYLDDSEEEQAQINALETGIKEIEPERSMPKYALNRDCELELNYELSKAFDLKTYSQITAQITFSYDKNNHKLTLIHSSPLNFSLVQKESLKSVFTKVYGEAVALSSRARVKNENLGTKSQNSIINDSGVELWEKVKDAVKLAKGEAYVRSWLQPLAAKLDEENKKLSVSGPMFFLSFIQRDLEPALEQVMKRAGYTCDLIGYERGEEKLVASVPFVKFFPMEGRDVRDISVNLKRW